MEIAIILFLACLLILAVVQIYNYVEYKRKLELARISALNRAISEIYDFSARFRKMSMQANLYSHDTEFEPESREYYGTASGIWAEAASRLDRRLKKLQEEIKDGRRS